MGFLNFILAFIIGDILGAICSFGIFFCRVINSNVLRAMADIAIIALCLVLAAICPFETAVVFWTTVIVGISTMFVLSLAAVAN